MTTKFWSQLRQVNQNTTGSQNQPDVAVLSTGEYAVVYQDNGLTPKEIFVQRYSAFGEPVGAIISAGFTTTGFAQPTITALPNGAFAVAWLSASTTISLQKFSADATTNGVPITIATNASSNPFSIPDMVGLADGSIALTYVRNTSSEDIVLKTISSTGVVSGEIDVDVLAGSIQSEPYIASNGSNIVITWRDGSVNSGDIQARTFNLLGTATAAEVTVNTSVTGNQVSSPLTALPDGGYVVVWHDENDSVLRGQRLTSTLGKQGAEFVVALNADGNDDNIGIAATQNGGFFVAYRGVDLVLYGQAMTAFGVPDGNRIRIADSVSNSPSTGVAAMADGRIVVTWTDTSGLDGSGNGIFTRIFDPRGGVIDGTSAANSIYGHQSDGDQINGFGGNDTLYGLGGNDVVDGEAGNDLAIGGTGNDTLYGWFGTDTLVGEGGDDTAFGWDGDDQLAGHDGNDFLIGERGNDTLWGDAGNDRLGGSDGNDQLFGFADNDTLWGDAGDDTLEGGTGNDELYGFADNDRIDGQDGDDLLFGWFGNDTMLGGDGNDRMEGEDGDDRMFGWFGNDTLGGWGGADLVDGEEGNDLLFGGGDNDTIYGGGGNDDLVGEDGNDFMWGFFGDDSLQGGGGNDTLGGEAGLDRFFYFAGFGNDEIIGFEAGGGPDVVHLIGIGSLTNFGQVTAAMSIVGGNVVLNAGAGQSITFVGIGSVGAFAADDFVFG